MKLRSMGRRLSAQLLVRRRPERERESLCEEGYAWGKSYVTPRGDCHASESLVLVFSGRG